MATARGTLMLSPRLRLDMADMAATVAATAVDTTARGLLMLSLRLMLLLRLAMAMAVMAAAMVVMAATATAGATATGVSYHQIRRSELSQKENHKNSHC